MMFTVIIDFYNVKYSYLRKKLMSTNCERENSFKQFSFEHGIADTDS